MSAGRRQLAYAVLVCAAGAGLALFAATRTWSVEVVARPAPLPALRTPRTGGALLPWLPALAVVGLAGAGAVIATRAAARRVVGVLLLVVAGGLVAGGVHGLTLGRGAAGASAAAWPALVALGGLLLAAGALATVLRGPRWPAMGARYERPAGPGGRAERPGAPAPAPADDDPRRAGNDDPWRAWDALDRGEDPTVS